MRLGSRGDTIIEVLIAIAVLSSVLGGAYVAANKSLNTSQSSLERSAATKILETQIERLKTMVAIGTPDVFHNPPTNTYFCVNALLATVATGNIPAAVSSDNLSATPAGAYPAQCIVDKSSTTYTSSSTSIPYYISVQRDAVDINKFTFRARWFSAGGQSTGKDEAVIAYRLYP